MEKTYLTCAQTARLIRKALKQAFPGVTFYVRSKTYSGGASIDINWKDGPTDKEVDTVAGAFSGKGFDGMIDLAYYYNHWMLPDGTVQIASSPGTVGSMGTVPAVKNDKPHPDAKLVSFGADYIHTSRAYSRKLVERVGQSHHEKTGMDIPPIEGYGWWTGGKERGKTYGFARGQWNAGSRPTDEWFNRELWQTSGETT